MDWNISEVFTAFKLLLKIKTFQLFIRTKFPNTNEWSISSRRHKIFKCNRINIFPWRNFVTRRWVEYFFRLNFSLRKIFHDTNFTSRRRVEYFFRRKLHFPTTSRILFLRELIIPVVVIPQILPRKFCFFSSILKREKFDSREVEEFICDKYFKVETLRSLWWNVCKQKTSGNFSSRPTVPGEILIRFEDGRRKVWLEKFTK